MKFDFFNLGVPPQLETYMFFKDFGLSLSRQVVDKAPKDDGVEWAYHHTNDGGYFINEQYVNRGVMVRYLKPLVDSVDLLESNSGLNMSREKILIQFLNGETIDRDLEKAIRLVEAYRILVGITKI